MNLNLSQFSTHYIPRITPAIANNHHFVLEDSLGTDAQTLSYLFSQPSFDSQRVAVHISRPGNSAKLQAMVVKTFLSEGKYNRKDPRARHLERDKGMTECGDYDVLWVRSEEGSRELYGMRHELRVSATKTNRLRRMEVGKVIGKKEWEDLLRTLASHPWHDGSQHYKQILKAVSWLSTIDIINSSLCL